MPLAMTNMGNALAMALARSQSHYQKYKKVGPFPVWLLVHVIL